MDSQSLDANLGHSEMDKEILTTRNPFSIEKNTNICYETNDEYVSNNHGNGHSIWHLDSTSEQTENEKPRERNSNCNRNACHINSPPPSNTFCTKASFSSIGISQKQTHASNKDTVNNSVKPSSSISVTLNPGCEAYFNEKFVDKGSKLI